MELKCLGPPSLGTVTDVCGVNDKWWLCHGGRLTAVKCNSKEVQQSNGSENKQFMEALMMQKKKRQLLINVIAERRHLFKRIVQYKKTNFSRRKKDTSRSDRRK